MVKLNKQQVAIVAQKVKEQIEAKQKPTPKQVQAVDEYLWAKSNLDKASEAITKQKDELNRNFEKTHKINIDYYSKTKTQLLDKFKKKANLSEIENEIVLNSIFDNSSDLDGFIAKLVKKFS